jgi:hypothetical protein
MLQDCSIRCGPRGDSVSTEVDQGKKTGGGAILLAGVVAVVWLVVVLVVLACGLYAFKVWADRIEDDSENMVEPGSRQPYGQWAWNIVRGRSDD